MLAQVLCTSTKPAYYKVTFVVMMSYTAEHQSCHDSKFSSKLATYKLACCSKQSRESVSTHQTLLILLLDKHHR